MTVYGRPLPQRSLPPRAGAAARPTPASNATLVARDDVTATLAVFTVALDEPLGPFRPGQYVSLGLVRDGEIVQRPYSLTALDAGGTRLELFIRRLPDGRFSNLLWPLPLGARVRVGPPRGLFTFDARDPRPRLMVGTGTGLAPLLAMLADASTRNDQTPNVLVHGVSYHAELAFGGRIGDWIDSGLPVDYRPTVSRPGEKRNSAWSGPTGRAEEQVQRLLDELPEMRGAVAYLCGNPDMIQACSAVLRTGGLRLEDIRSEQFHVPTAGAERPPRPT